MMTGCGKHDYDYFDENCQACALTVSRPKTADDLPSPHFPVEVKGLIIDPALVEEAKRAGRGRIQAEKEADDKVREARRYLSDIVDGVRKASGKIHVHENELKLGKVKIDPNKGITTGGYNVEELLQLWELIPTMLRRHIDNCNRAIAEQEQKKAQADAIFQGARAVKALIDTPAPAEDKAEFVRRAMTDKDVQDALAAASDTGVSHAAFDVIRQQVGVPTESTHTDLFMYHFAQAYIEWAGGEPDDDIVLLFDVIGVGSWAFVPSCVAGSNTPVVERDPERIDHWRLNADLVLTIDKTTLENVLLRGKPSQDVGDALMHEYFKGKLTINGEAGSSMGGVEVTFVHHVGHMFAIAHESFSDDLDNRAFEEDEEDDIPF